VEKAKDSLRFIVLSVYYQNTFNKYNKNLTEKNTNNIMGTGNENQ